MVALKMKYPEEQESTQEATSSLSFSKVLLLFFLNMVVTLSTIAVFISYKTRYGCSDGMDTNLRKQYPGYFRFEDEQAAFASLPITVNGRSQLPIYSSTNQQRSSVFTKYLQIDHHACCESSELWFSPDYWVDYKGINRTMAVFSDPATGMVAKQYFYSETCIHKTKCQYKCKCSQKKLFVTGIYVDGGRYGIPWFPILGGCKCRNTATLFLKTLFQVRYRQ